jgi:predicted phage tail protein
MFQTKYRRISVALILLLGVLLSGCQGGASSDQSSTSGVSVTPVECTAGSDCVNTQISWTIPTTRVLGDFLSMSEIKGYRISFGTTPNNYTNSIIVSDAQQTIADIQVKSGSTYYFVVRAIDTAGLEGPESNIVERSV